ncbi:protein RKD5-like isoform X2 [Phragmites australis]|uniref:protein RKD5-like isoform X2 n=1 Tax=Phragmites australis TaxID=29695 RepID=UPI002D78620F|nr:protein RKD5-like isoform X2 [Phragmites australis]XP_062226444.1 protein RKD5-like isoform X2 [Phragmites australis]XP_062226445.1 protein RKD5-like isoform X2 [Phragmites australis]XP_062226446.1 protein RKD5-like isoform X2 [Phragmites australis]
MQVESTRTPEQSAVRSVHGYKVVGRKTGVGWVRWERWVERGFVLSAAACREVGVPAAAPRILLAECRGRPVFREGQTVGAWRCIVAFDSVAAVAPSSPPPPVLSPFGNPQLKCLPNLYNDLEKVFRFQTVEKVPKLQTRRKIIHYGEQEKTSDDADHASESDSDEDSQSELPPLVQKHPRASRKYIASITLVDIAQYFHLPIREASKTLKIGVSILKKKCRQYGIPRWPHRKIKSLDSLIHDLEYVLEDKTRDDVEKQKEKEKQVAAIKALTKRKRMLETEKETIQQKPALDLMAETKQFREDVFKRRYRAKNASSD